MTTSDDEVGADLTSAGPRTAFDHTMVAMAITDREGVLIAANDALTLLLGRPASELVGESLLSLTHEEDVARAVGACRSLDAPEVRTSELAVRMLRPDDQIVHVTVSTAKVLGADGAVSHLVMQLQDVSDHVRTESRLRLLALHDVLTGLPNRALLEDRLEHALHRQHRDQLPLSVLFVDLDDFKAVNDSRGHRAGDEVLREAATALLGAVRTGTTVARVGGDEFVVVCENTTRSEAEHVVERLHAALRDHPPLATSGLRLTASIGVATAEGVVGDVADARASLVALADAAMYRAKSARHDRRPQPTGDDGDDPRS